MIIDLTGRRALIAGGSRGIGLSIARALAAAGAVVALCARQQTSLDAGAALPLARELAEKVADNAPLSNYFMIQALARIEDMSKADGLFTESLCAALSQTSPDAQEGLRAFLEKRTPRFR